MFIQPRRDGGTTSLSTGDGTPAPGSEPRPRPNWPRQKEEKEVSKKGCQIAIDMDFSELVNRRLDHLQAYNSQKHYEDYRYLARKWVQRWNGLKCHQITSEMIEQYILERSRVSAHTANKELRTFRSLFNFGKKRRLVQDNPTDDLGFLPLEKKVKYVPSVEEIDKLLSEADEDMQEYLWTIRETMARVGEINRLTWEDVDLDVRFVILYTRKKRGGHLTPRKVPMTDQLHSVLLRRYAERDPVKPWVFWHRYFHNKTGQKMVGPYKSRRRAMRTLCRKADVRYFGFHALRHSGASVMERANVPIGSIQRILGHENRQTTEIYLHSIGQAERHAMAVFEQVRGENLTPSLTQPIIREQAIRCK